MFGFGKQHRQEKAKRELLEIGERVVGIVNEALERWRATSLEMRRSMLDEAFAERIVALELSEGLSFETLAEIEALALMKNWADGVSDRKVEFVQLLDRDTLDCLATLGIGGEVEGHLDRHIAEVSVEIEEDLDRAIIEAVQRRGEVTTRAGGRDLFDRCLRDEPFVDSLTLAETLDYMGSILGDDPTAKKAIGIMRRLYDLAFFEHRLSTEERQLALSMAGAVEADIESALQDNEESLTSFRQAVNYQKERARHCGFGSLQWKLDEQEIPAVDLVEFIVREEYADLLPAFLEMLEPQLIADIRTEILKALVATRAHRRQSAVQILSELAVVPYAALTILLDPSEIQVLRRTDTDLPAAEKLVAALLGNTPSQPV